MHTHHATSSGYRKWRILERTHLHLWGCMHRSNRSSNSIAKKWLDGKTSQIYTNTQTTRNISYERAKDAVFTGGANSSMELLSVKRLHGSHPRVRSN